MLEYDIRGKLHQCGILHPVVWLSKTLHCSKSKASDILNNKIKVIHPNDLWRICLKLSCTPNDLMVINTNSKRGIPADHPILAAIPRKEKRKSMVELLASLSPEATEEFITQLNSASNQKKVG